MKGKVQMKDNKSALNRKQRHEKFIRSRAKAHLGAAKQRKVTFSKQVILHEAKKKLEQAARNHSMSNCSVKLRVKETVKNGKHEIAWERTIDVPSHWEAQTTDVCQVLVAKGTSEFQSVKSMY